MEPQPKAKKVALGNMVMSPIGNHYALGSDDKVYVYNVSAREWYLL